MKNFVFGIVIPSLLITAVGCKEKKEQQVIIIKKPKMAKVEKPQKMEDLRQTHVVYWMGNKYTVETYRTSVDSLPLATDGARRYYDNCINMNVYRSDGTLFFSHKFLKSDFRDYVDNSYYEGGALLGIAFEKANGSLLIFGASVGSPDRASDEYVPLIVKVNNTGNYSIEKDPEQDVGSMRNEPDTDDE